MNLAEKLCEILPIVLPKDSGSALTGTDLWEVLKDHFSEYQESSLRQAISRLAQDASSPVAKVEGRPGYYLRQAEPGEDDTAPSAATEGAGETSHAPAVPADQGPYEPTPREIAVGRDAQPEERFRAFFMKYMEQRGWLPIHVEHTEASRQAGGVNKWKFPDVVLIQWDEALLVEGNRLDPSKLEFKRLLGEQPFSVRSVELKVKLTLGNFREAFFQAVSNSSWSHTPQLCLAATPEDEVLVRGLRQLGSSFGVGVVCFGLNDTQLAQLPAASEVHAMNPRAFDDFLLQLGPNWRVDTLSPVGRKTSLDWAHLKDLEENHKVFHELAAWLARCAADKRAYKLKDFRELLAAESSASRIRDGGTPNHG